MTFIRNNVLSMTFLFVELNKGLFNLTRQAAARIFILQIIIVFIIVIVVVSERVVRVLAAVDIRLTASDQGYRWTG